MYKKNKSYSSTGIFVGPQIRQLIKDEYFLQQMTVVEKNAWKGFVSVCENFLGNTKSVNYEEIVHEMLSAYHALGCKMSIKLHHLHAHLNMFPSNLGQMSDEQGERFHQEISRIEQRYVGKSKISMLSNYCWSIKRDTDRNVYKKQLKRKHF